MMCAGAYGNVDAMRSWVASGAVINVVDMYGMTPLMLASRYLYTECVAEMLRLGADARRVDNRGMTALHWVAELAGRGGDGVGVVRQLVAAGWCATTTATRLSSWHAITTERSGRLGSRGGLRRRWRE